MSQFRINDHVRFRVMTSEGTLTGSGQIIKIIAAGQSHWLHVRQGDGAVRMLYEATSQIEALERYLKEFPIMKVHIKRTN